MRDSQHSKPRSGERDVSGDDDLEMLRRERERERERERGRGREREMRSPKE